MDEKTPEEQTPETPEEEKIKKQKKSNENFLYNSEVGQLISDLNAIKIKLKSPDSKEEFKCDLTLIKKKYDEKIATQEKERLVDFRAGNKSRCINLKISSNKTKKIKVKRFRSRRNKK
jgi:hypothetical protein